MRPLEGGSDQPATRRRVLRLTGVPGAALLAGCTEDVGAEFPENREWPLAGRLPALPVRERAAVMAERIEAMADAPLREPADLEGAFDGYALELEFAERERDVLRVGYEDPERRTRGDLGNVGLLAGAYAALVGNGYDATALGVEILDDAPASYGVATAESAWAERYLGGDLSAEGYGELVAGTIEFKRHAPEVDVSPDE